MHGQYGCIEDIELIYLLGRGGGYGPGYGFVLYVVTESLAGLPRELLGIVQARILEVTGQYDGCGVDRPCYAAQSRLVSAGL